MLRMKTVERNLVGLDRELYVTLKFFNICFRNTKDQEIPTYILKEIYCAYIANSRQRLKDEATNEESLALRLVKLITFATENKIASPFYCTHSGSCLERTCALLLRRIGEKYFTYL